jgi:hypothetical protein
MKLENTIVKVIALLSLILLLATIADSQMNRDDPFLGSKLPKTSDESILSNVKTSSSSIVISEPLSPLASPDLTVTPDPESTTCSQAAFFVTLTPDSSQTTVTGYHNVKVKIMENPFGTPRSVAELTLVMPAAGSTVHEIIGFAGAAAQSGQNRSTEITVYVDPNSEIKESNENNNILSITGVCPG